MIFKLMSYIYHKGVFYITEFDLKDLTMDWENPYGITFEKYNDKDFKLLEDTLRAIGEKSKLFTIDTVDKRLNAGHMLFIAKSKGRIIGLYWVATNYIDNLKFPSSIHLNKDKAYTYNSYIVEEYRGKNINKGLKIFAFDILKQKGYKKVFAFIQNTNQSSLRANEKFGSRIIGKTTWIRLMTFEFRYTNFSTKKMAFIDGGPFRLWKVLFRKIKEKVIHKMPLSFL
jgi:GNAT superfamily N-acetyltransferase